MLPRALPFLYLLCMQEAAGESTPVDPTGVLEPAAKAGSLLFNLGLAGTFTVLIVACVLLIRWWNTDKRVLNEQITAATGALATQSISAHEELKTQMKEQHEREKEYISALSEFRRTMEMQTSEIRDLKGQVSILNTQVATLAAKG